MTMSPLARTLSAAALAVAVSAWGAVPAAAADDSDCRAWAQVFLDVEVVKDKVVWTSELRCIWDGTTTWEEPPPAPKDKPFPGGHYGLGHDCTTLARAIETMQEAIRKANNGLPGALVALEQAAGVATAEHEAYKDARSAWKDASDDVQAALQAYHAVYGSDFEIDLDGSGHPIRISTTYDYDPTTPEGQAVEAAMAQEAAARAAMDDAWDVWVAAGGSAEAAQHLVDLYEGILRDYPRDIELAQQEAADLGCK